MKKLVLICILCFVFGITSCNDNNRIFSVKKSPKQYTFQDTVIIYLTDDDLQFYRALLMSSLKDGEYFQTRTLIVCGERNKWAVRLVYNKNL